MQDSALQDRVVQDSAQQFRVVQDSALEDRAMTVLYVRGLCNTFLI